jgi:hypothetical protein
MPRTDNVRPGWRSSLRGARDPAVLAFAGAILLVCAPALPGLARIIVLPALLLAPGYALLRLLGQAAGPRSISVAVPVSLVLAICAALVLDASGIGLGPLSLGLSLGTVTALLLAGSYGRQLAAGQRPRDHGAAQGDQDQRPHRRSSGDLLDRRSGRPALGGRDATASERR